MRRLVVNADDFGASAATNRGILRAHARGIVTSTSLMVRGPGAGEAAQAAREYPDLGFGLHVDLGEWAYRDLEWRELYRVVDLDDARAVNAEVQRQIEAFRAILNADPTHIDSHQHVHREGAPRDAVLAIAERLRIPVRHFTPSIRYCGSFYGQSGKGHPCPEQISPEALARAIDQLPQGDSELACHPGFDAHIDSIYRAERLIEVESLCHPDVRHAIEQHRIQLVSFRELQL